MPEHTVPAPLETPTSPRSDGRRWRRRRERVGPFVLVIVAGLGLIAGHVHVVRERARAMIAREEAVLLVLERVHDAERRLHERGGRYGFVGDLESAELLPGLEVVEEEGRRYVASEGYRIDVLLPHVRLGPNLIGISPDGAERRPDPELVERHFSLVARPLAPLESGARMYYLDERDELFLNEGIVDDGGARLNPLPRVQIRRPRRLDSANVIAWQRAADVRRTRD